MRRALAVLAVAAAVLTGCAESDDSPTVEGTGAASSPAGSPTTEDSSAAPTATASDDADDAGADAIEVEIEGDRIEPNGLRVQVGAGETVTFDVESDRAAQLHVHSSPEQVLEIEPGEPTLTLVIGRPGLVDIEEHDTGMVLVQLEVR